VDEKPKSKGVFKVDINKRKKKNNILLIIKKKKINLFLEIIFINNS
jgi:hypothetical protein